jgi:dinuclear metal center YbgI/SA1388 family protein
VSTTVKTLLALLNQLYPPELASEWDSIGLIAGKKSQKVSSILLCVDITPDIVNEALTNRCDAVVSHHPLVLGEDVLEPAYKAHLLELAEKHQLAFLNCHTNADAMMPGVSDALAALLGVKQLCVIEEIPGSSYGIGRIGNLQDAISFPDFVNHVRRVLPQSAIRHTASPEHQIHRVAVCAGSGASLLSLVRQSDADVYITSDLKHHPVLEHLAEGGCPLIDIDHGIAESIYLKGLQASLETVLDVPILISQLPFGTWVAQ